MFPSSPQVPPPGRGPPGTRPGVVHNTTGGPPSRATFFNLPAAKKATDFPSGEKNGKAPPSVPSNQIDWSGPSRRTYTPVWLGFPRAVYTKRVPSGDKIALELPSPGKLMASRMSGRLIGRVPRHSPNDVIAKPTANK